MKLMDKAWVHLALIMGTWLAVVMLATSPAFVLFVLVTVALTCVIRMLW